MGKKKKQRPSSSVRLERYYFSALMLFFVCSLILSIVENKSVTRVKLCVKDKQSGRMVIQRRSIPHAATTEEKVYWILRELVSGPVGNRYEKILDPNIEIKNVIIQRNTAYVSFNWSLVDSLYDNSSQALCSITNSILLNIRELDGIKILIDDIEPVSTLCNLVFLKRQKRSFENGNSSYGEGPL